MVDFVAAQPLDRLFVSTATLAEIRFGIECVADVGRRAELDAWLTLRVRPLFEHRVLEITEDVMFTWRILAEEGSKAGQKAGHGFPQPDLIIAATALRHGLTIVTRDAADYRKIRVPSLNPSTDAWS